MASPSPPPPPGPPSSGGAAVPGLDEVLALAWAQAGQGQIPAAARLLEDALQAAGHTLRPSAWQRSRIDWLLGTAWLMAGRYEAGLARLLPALEQVDERPAEGAEAPPAWACSALGFALGAMGDPSRGLAWVARAVQLAELGAQPLDLLKARSDEGCLLAMLGEHARAVAALQQAASLAAKSAPRYAQSGVLNNLGFTWLAQARDPRTPAIDARAAAAQALASAERALAAAAPAGVPHTRASALAIRGEAHLLLGQLAEADMDLQSALAQDGLPLHTRVDVLRSLAACQRLQAQADAARWLTDMALRLSAGDGCELARARVLDERLCIETTLGDAASAQHWAGRREDHARALFQRRLSALARSGELMAQAERQRQSTPPASAAPGQD